MLKNEKAGMEVQIGNLEADVRFLKRLIEEAYREGYRDGVSEEPEWLGLCWKVSRVKQILEDFEEGL